ncbi:Pectinesterase, catalytic [Dillenia turbinata]|uniref:Pectinesterase, catalytic n=1 Tax=Dillenia turbinata TaxID=194707 RepID=A0AAN8VYC2_9MAGN
MGNVFCHKKFYAVGGTQVLDENKDEALPLQSQNFADLLGVPEVGFSNGRKGKTKLIISLLRVIVNANPRVYVQKSYLGRPWGTYSRTAVIETHIDDLIDPSGWLQWEGKSDRVLSTLYYAEYGNSGEGSSLQNRVQWPGFHALRSRSEASPFSVSNLIQGDTWIPHSGIPFSADI